MAPLPFYNTDRLEVFYTTGIEEHSFLVRYDGATPNEAAEEVDIVLGNMADLLRTITITRTTYGIAGSPLTFPIITILQGDSYGAGVANNKEDALSISATGRSSDGRRVSFHVFGAKDNFPANDFRLLPAENAGVASTITSLNAATAAFFSISGQPAVWNNYLNVNFNAYWQRRKR